MSSIVGRTLKRGTLATIGAGSMLQVGAGKQFTLPDGTTMEFDRDLKPTNIIKNLNEARKELDFQRKWPPVTGVDSFISSIIDSQILQLLGITYGGALGITVTGDILKAAREKVRDSRNASTRIKSIKSALGKNIFKGVRIRKNDVLIGKSLYGQFGNKINVATWKNISPGTRLIYLSYTTDKLPLVIQGGMTAREKQFLDAHEARSNFKTRKLLPPPRPKVAKHAVIQKNPMYPPGTMPLARPSKPLPLLFNEMLGGTPEQRRSKTQRAAHEKWWASLSPRKQKKFLKEAERSSKKALSKVKREKFIKKLFRRI